MSWAVAWMLAGAAMASTADTGLLDAADADGDGDGVTIAEGDCDDTNEETFPNAPELCADQQDNDCDGLFDENCDSRARMGEVRGGGGCSEGIAASFLLLPALLIARRRSR